MSDSDGDVSELKDQISSINQSLSDLNDKVAGLTERSHDDDDHLVAVTGTADQLKQQVTDLQQQMTELGTKVTGLENVQQEILRYMQQFPLWWSIVVAAAGGHQIQLPEYPAPPST